MKPGNPIDFEVLGIVDASNTVTFFLAKDELVSAPGMLEVQMDQECASTNLRNLFNDLQSRGNQYGVLSVMNGGRFTISLQNRQMAVLLVQQIVDLIHAGKHYTGVKVLAKCATTGNRLTFMPSALMHAQYNNIGA